MARIVSALVDAAILVRLSRWVITILFALSVVCLPSVSSAQIGVGLSITIAPPALPIYDQPPIPAPGYIWTPGYWEYGPDGYYWVPGTWVEPPAVELLWTPGYWGWNDGVYVWSRGYWGPEIGYYGGINYGFGYVGIGYAGGYWNRGVFYYNTTVNNFGNTTIVNTYNKTVIINNTTVNRVSFNGPGGATAKPTPNELVAARAQHTPPTALQVQHAKAASNNPALLASANHGSPPIAATAKPGQFSGPGTVKAKITTMAPGATPGTGTSTKGPPPTGGKPAMRPAADGMKGTRNTRPRGAGVTGTQIPSSTLPTRTLPKNPVSDSVSKPSSGGPRGPSPQSATRAGRPADVRQPPRPAEMRSPPRPADVRQPPRPADVRSPPRPADVRQPPRQSDVRQPPQARPQPPRQPPPPPVSRPQPPQGKPPKPPQ